MARKPTVFEVLPWVPTFFGVTLMIGLLIFAIVISLRPGADGDSSGFERSLAPPVEPPPAVVEPTPPPVATGSPTPTASATSSPTAVPAAPIRPTPTRASAPDPAQPPPTTVAPRPELTGRYRVLDSFGDSFIGEVLVSNSAGSARSWTVRLRFPSNVSGPRTFWIEGAPQGGMRRSGADYIFTSGVPLGARSSVPLRFQFDRTGRGDTPSACSVNGTACT